MPACCMTLRSRPGCERLGHGSLGGRSGRLRGPALGPAHGALHRAAHDSARNVISGFVRRCTAREALYAREDMAAGPRVGPLEGGAVNRALEYELLAQQLAHRLSLTFGVAT